MQSRSSAPAAAAGAALAERQRKRSLSADLVMFPAAALFSMVALPLWIYAGTSARGTQYPIATAYVHGHEMLFGYALAVIAGFLISKCSARRLALLALSWLVARITPFFVAPDSVLSGLPDLLFAAVLAHSAAPMFMRAAKKPQNRVIGPLLIAICSCPLLYYLGGVGALPDGRRLALLLAVDLITLLMLLMGGRTISPAVAGYYYRRGKNLQARVQPRLERLVILFMAAGAVSDLIPGAGAISGACALAAAAATAVRAFRWRLWTVLDRPELWALGLGYLWLSAGLALKAAAQIGGAPSLNHALHGLTIGALGTLTLTIMARTHETRQRRPLEHFGDIGCGAVLIGLAALLRLGIAYTASATVSASLQWAAGISWILAMTLLLRRLLHFSPR